MAEKPALHLFNRHQAAIVHDVRPSRSLSAGAAGLLMFDVARLQLPQGCHHSVLQRGLLSSFAFRRTACPGVRRRAWAVRAAWSGNEKTEKEIAAHFAMFRRKGGGEDRAKHAAGQNGRLEGGCAATRCVLLCNSRRCSVNALLSMYEARTNGSLPRSKHVLPLFMQYKNLPPDGKVGTVTTRWTCVAVLWSVCGTERAARLHLSRA